MERVIRITVNVSTGYVGSERDREVEVVVPEDIEQGSEKEHELLEEAARECVYDMIYWGWSVK